MAELLNFGCIPPTKKAAGKDGGAGLGGRDTLQSTF